MSYEDSEDRNLLDSAAAHLPKPQPLFTQIGPSGNPSDARHVVAVPQHFRLETVDTEDLMPAPRRIVAQATVDSLDSFVAYVQRHQRPETVVWVKLNPLTSALTLTGRIDEHANDKPSWRRHSVTFTPQLSVEWKRWMEKNGAAQKQVDFALFIENNIADVANVDGLPTGAAMLEMALLFEATQDSRVKSHVRLQNGGVKFEFVGDDDAATVSRMEVFGKFAVGLPVFWGGDRYRVDARLRYSTREGEVKLWYEFIRPDKVHEAAAGDVVNKLRQMLGDTVPVFMGAL